MPLDGRIGRIELEPGDTVKKGQQLVPFDRLPLRYERAFGGEDKSASEPTDWEGEPRNPIGRGFRATNCSGFGDPCIIASCDTNGAEGNCDILTPVPEGGTCDDGDACLVGETCQSGTCTAGTALD